MNKQILDTDFNEENEVMMCGMCVLEIVFV